MKRPSLLRRLHRSLLRCPGQGSFKHPSSWAAPLLALALLGACASLPDLGYLDGQPRTGATPAVVGVDGKLGGNNAESLLSQRLRNAQRTSLKNLALLEQTATGSPLIAGNRVTLLFDGPQTFDAMFKAIEGARDHINLETYIFDQDELGMRFADMLIARQKAGVQVNIIHDGVGTLGTPAAFFDRLRAAGVRLITFNPVNPLKRSGDWRINNRDHRKLLIVDGKIGFTGGINIAADYASSSLGRSQGKRNETLGWRDTHIRVEGPAVASMQLLFLQTWASQQQEALPDLNYFPRLAVAGDQLIRVLGSAPGGDFEIYKAYYLALKEAKKSAHLTVAYFGPDRQILQALLDAARRGVDVHMIFPSVSDAPAVFYSGRSFYSALLDAGVKISEFQGSVLHAKTAVIDGAWSTVGSANIDIRSFLHNSEINVIVVGTAFGKRMEDAFVQDLRNSLPVTGEKWEQRSLIERFKEWSARNFAYFL